ncbi:uncharacterized protein LOC127832537 [Dreissena polymorpha]|uniref:uncharacterized protein LOC127832537 n=1 Tax=Dreissena polymorpha TaxID=45954 RepID=UPI0022647BDA|nr:uncharacterized protein LOC127832537 [Dreissena polymorpha]
MLIKRRRRGAKLFVSLLLVVWAVSIYRQYLKSANDIANQWHYYLNPLEGTEFMNMHRDMFELTIDTPDPKLIGEGKDLFKPRLKKVRHFDNNIVLFSAVAGNSSSEHIWDTIDIVGWENKNLIRNTYKCCVRYTSGEVQSVPATRIIWSNILSNMSAMQFVCSNLTSRFGELPEVATLEGRNKKCHSLFDWYLPVTFAHAHKNEIAVCYKIAYGSLAADDLLSWFELHRRLGVTKVLVFTHDLNPEATRVLQYYRALGMADTVPFAYPTDGRIVRQISRRRGLHVSRENSHYLTELEEHWLAIQGRTVLEQHAPLERPGEARDHA